MRVIIMMTGLYGMSEKERSYYRQCGTDSHEWVCRKSHATVLTKEQADIIMADKEAYLKQYKAKDLKIIKL